MNRILTTTAACALALGAGTAVAQTVVTMNTVQIFGTIDPAAEALVGCWRESSTPVDVVAGCLRTVGAPDLADDA